MTDAEGSYYRDRALDGSQAAAAWALRLLADTGGPQAAGELFDVLHAMEPTTRRVALMQLVNLVGRTAARPEVSDLATLRRYLDYMVMHRVSDAVADEHIRRANERGENEGPHA